MIGGPYMDVRTLYYFVTIAEELNITKAAEKLCMSQPPLSNQMKMLEEELDTVFALRKAMANMSTQEMTIPAPAWQTPSRSGAL